MTNSSSLCRMAGLLLTGFLLATGCSGRSPTSTGEAPSNLSDQTTDQAAPAEASAAATNEPAIKVVDAQGLDEIIENNEGRVVLVDFWATWCSPCKKMFPHTVELARQHAAEGLSVVTVSCDSAKAEPQVVAFLQQFPAQEAALEHVRVADDRTFVDDFKIENGTLPYLRIYGRDGQVLRTFVQGDPQGSGFDDADVEAAVKEALAAGK
ncbi:MAG: TlpA family protein disulfide reductase [Pirellulales bacterium]|nr:TlpA family protein disulfide reductase [Pirellulales bacterium]